MLRIFRAGNPSNELKLFVCHWRREKMLRVMPTISHILDFLTLNKCKFFYKVFYLKFRLMTNFWSRGETSGAGSGFTDEESVNRKFILLRKTEFVVGGIGYWWKTFMVKTMSETLGIPKTHCRLVTWGTNLNTLGLGCSIAMTKESRVDCSNISLKTPPPVSWRPSGWICYPLFAGLKIRLFNFTIKVFSCILYCLRVIQDSGELPEHVKIKPATDGIN